MLGEGGEVPRDWWHEHYWAVFCVRRLVVNLFVILLTRLQKEKHGFISDNTQNNTQHQQGVQKSTKYKEENIIMTIVGAVVVYFDYGLF